MSDATVRKLEWACKEIERLSKEISMLKNPGFWRLEAIRQSVLGEGDLCRTMSAEDIARFLPKQTAGSNRLYEPWIQ